jgi:hypothetical protein
MEQLQRLHWRDKAALECEADSLDVGLHQLGAKRSTPQFGEQIRGAIIANSCDRIGRCGR